MSTLPTIAEPVNSESAQTISEHSGKANGTALRQEEIPFYMLEMIKRYKIEVVPASSIHPSPENDELYGQVGKDDPAMPTLVKSIERLGLEEPLILTQDRFILSGHRRFYALQQLGCDLVPVRFANVWRANTTDYHRLLAQYNPQRIKSVAATLSEKLLDSEDEDEDDWSEYQEQRNTLEVETMRVHGAKSVDPIGERQGEFLKAVKKVVDSMRAYWPLTVRQIHYKLLNKPPLTQVTKDRSERWRYTNCLGCYNKLSGLLVSARYAKEISFQAIDDSTRESQTHNGFSSVREFMDDEVENFLYGYNRSRQEGQPRHIEVVVEKNTLLNIVSSVCSQFHVPLTPLRGYGGPSVWERIESRYRLSDAYIDNDGDCVVIILSDHDPEGFNLADDCVRSLRDNHDVPVQAIRPLITLEQVKTYGLPSNPIKEKSPRYREYVNRTGITECWECEALDPEVTRKTLHDAILSVIDVDQLNAVQEREAEEIKQINAIRRRLGTKLSAMIAEEGL